MPPLQAFQPRSTIFRTESSDYDERDCRAGLSKLPEHVHAVKIRQSAVRDYEIKSELLSEPQALLARWRERHIVSSETQRCAKGLESADIVIDDKNTRHRCASGFGESIT